MSHGALPPRTPFQIREVSELRVSFLVISVAEPTAEKKGEQPRIVPHALLPLWDVWIGYFRNSSRCINNPIPPRCSDMSKVSIVS